MENAKKRKKLNDATEGTQHEQLQKIDARGKALHDKYDTKQSATAAVAAAQKQAKAAAYLDHVTVDLEAIKEKKSKELSEELAVWKTVQVPIVAGGMEVMWSTTAIFKDIIKSQPSNISKMKTVDGKIGKVEACQIIASHYRRLTLQ